MPILELPPNPAKLRNSESPESGPGAPQQPPPIRVLAGRFANLEEHEIIHLLDSIDDEVSRARFRESIYKSIIICMAIAWFLFYGPRVLFHQPEYKDLISAMKEHDKQITYLERPHAPALRPPPAHAIPDRKTLQQMQQQPRTAPTPPAPQAPAPQPQEQAHLNTPPIAQPALPLPSAPTRQAQQALPDAPHATTAQNNQSNPDSTQQTIRGSRTMHSGVEYGPAPGSSSGPLEAGATILSDTMGVDFSAYMRQLRHDIQRNWDPLIPEEVQAPLRKKGIVGIRFSILPNGQIGGMILEGKSGDVALDKAAWYAITSEGTFPPLPKDFHGPQLELRVGFYYNTPLQ